jgi:PAS domain S-box-containing protein
MRGGSVSQTASLSGTISRWQGSLKILVWLLAIEAAIAGVLRVQVVLGSIASGKAFELVEAASAIGLLMFPAMLYAIVRLRKAQKEMHDLVSEEQQSSHATRVLLDTTTEGIYGIDVDGKCTMANRAAGELLGYGPEELIGRDMHDLIHHSKANGSPYPSGECPIRRVISDGEGCEVEDEVFWRRDGTSFSAAYSSNPILDSDGIHGAVVSFRDIVERKRMEQAIRDAERRVLNFMQDLPIGVFVIDQEGHPVYSNHASQALLGAEADTSLEGTDLTEAYGVRIAGSGDPYPTERLPVVRALSGETVTVDDVEVHRPDGDAVPLEVWAGPIRDRNGDIRYAAAAFTDISVRKETEDALRASEQAVRRASEIADRERQAAEQANLAKSAFLSRMSHELRTPLNGILGFSQLLEMDELEPDQQDSVTHIHRAGRHLLDLINEVLDLSRIEAGRLSMSLEPIALPELIDECVRLIDPFAAERSVDIVVHEDSQRAHYVLADRQRMRQILLNLLSNAVKYGRPAGTIEVSWERAGEDGLEISVSDTGPGIAPEKLGRLFTEFDRLDIMNGQEEGTGLGLALSKRLAEAMGGTLEATSELGVGSRFTVQLPAAGDAPEPLEESPGLEHANAGHGLPRVLLYVEDNLANVELIKRTLELRPQVTLKTATEGKLGVDLARQLRPDLMLLDYNLPDLNGEDVLLRMRSDPRTATIPVVFLSADATEGQINRLMGAGAAAYLTKPLEIEQFLETIDRVMETTVEPDKR